MIDRKCWFGGPINSKSEYRNPSTIFTFRKRVEVFFPKFQMGFIDNLTS